MEPRNQINSRFSVLLSLSRINWRAWLPSRGNVVFTLMVIIALFWAQSANALPWTAPNAAATSTGTWPYQGRLADSTGTPITATVPMIFRLYSAPGSGATPLWEEQWTGPNSVQVSDGLFNVMLGSLTPISQSIVTGNGTLWLGITAGTDDEMTPRVQLGSVPFAVQALTVPDGSIVTTKLANGSVTQAKLGADVSLIPPDGSITTPKLADNAVTSAKIVDGSVAISDLASGMFPFYSASTNTPASGYGWVVPGCSGSLDNNGSYYAIPGLSFNITLNRTSNVSIDLAGLGANWTAGKAIFTSIFVNGVRTTDASGMTLVGGCRNSTNDTNGPPWCNLATSTARNLAPGTYTIDARAFCDGGSVNILSGWLKAIVLP